MFIVFRRLLVLVAMLYWLPFAHATNIDDLIPLHDYPDDSSAGQIVYITDAKMGKWVGFDAFTGHIDGKMYKSGNVSWTQHFHDCYGFEDGDANGSIQFSFASGDIYSTIEQMIQPTPYAVFRGPPPDYITPTEEGTVEPQICGTCEQDGEFTTRTAEAKLPGDTDNFNGLAILPLPVNNTNFGRYSDIINTAY
jgi:hypothetical protein